MKAAPRYRCFYCNSKFSYNPKKPDDLCSKCGREALLFIPPRNTRRPSKKFLPGVSSEDQKKLRQQVIQLGPIDSIRDALPRWVVQTIYRDYLQLASPTKTGKLYGTSPRTICAIFTKYKFAFCLRKSHMVIIYQGRTFSQDKNGYYNAKGKLLHHVLWMNYTGQGVPDGWQVGFKNNDKMDFRPDNLHCAPMGEIVRMHARRVNPQMRSRAQWKPTANGIVPRFERRS